MVLEKNNIYFRLVFQYFNIRDDIGFVKLYYWPIKAIKATERCFGDEPAHIHHIQHPSHTDNLTDSQKEELHIEIKKRKD